MPVVFAEIFGMYFYFWSNEGNEPCHIHVGYRAYDKAGAKFWVDPIEGVSVASKGNLKVHDFNRARKFAQDNVDHIVSQWYAFQARKQDIKKMELR